MGFFAEYDQITYSRTKLNTTDKERAIKLCRAVYANHKIKTRPSISRWAYQLHELNLELDFDGQTLDRVLDWYCQNYKDKFTPIVCSAEMFRHKFHQIEMAMQRSQKVDNVELVISRQARDLAKQLAEELNWPKNFSPKLPAAVESSLVNYQAFTKALLNKVKPKQLRCFILDTHLGSTSPREFIHRWFEAACERVHNWDEWSGSISSIMFRVSAPAFERMFTDWCREYTTDQRTIQEALKVVQRENQEGSK